MIVETTRGTIAVAAMPANHWDGYATPRVDSTAGQLVDDASVLGLSAVFGAVALISDANGLMPLEIIDTRAPIGGDRVVQKGYLPAMLQHAPNRDMSGVDVWTYVNAQLLLRGNAYLAKIRNAEGRVAELYPMLPGSVRPFRDPAGRKVFRVQLYDGTTSVDEVYDERSILHVKGRSLTDPLVGAGPIEHARNALGTQLAQKQYQAKAYKDGMLLKGLLSTPNPNLSEDAAARLKRQWRQVSSGMGSAHDVAILHSGLAFQQTALSPEDAQFIQTMRWGHTEVATLFCLPAADLNGEGASMTYSNVGQNVYERDRRACLPLRRMIEASVNRDADLFGPFSPWVPVFNEAMALRADVESRNRVYDQRRRNGTMSANDVRRAENEPEIEGGDEYTMVPATLPAGPGGAQGGAAAA